MERGCVGRRPCPRDLALAKLDESAGTRVGLCWLVGSAGRGGGYWRHVPGKLAQALLSARALRDLEFRIGEAGSTRSAAIFWWRATSALASEWYLASEAGVRASGACRKVVEKLRLRASAARLLGAWPNVRVNPDRGGEPCKAGRRRWYRWRCPALQGLP